MEAIELFLEMCNSRNKTDQKHFISLLSACRRRYLVLQPYVGGIWSTPETKHHACMLDILGRCGKLHEVYEFIKHLSTQPKAGVWEAMLSSCNYRGDTKTGKNVAELLFEIELKNDGYYISLSNMYVASGRWKEAAEIREIIESRKLRKTAGFSLALALDEGHQIF